MCLLKEPTHIHNFINMQDLKLKIEEMDDLQRQKKVKGLPPHNYSQHWSSVQPCIVYTESVFAFRINLHEAMFVFLCHSTTD